MKRLSATLASLALALTLAGCVAPVQEMPRQQVSASAHAIHEAVISVAHARRFDIVKDVPGTVTLSYPPRSSRRNATYRVTYAVHYRPGSYQVEYVDSRGLDVQRCSQADGSVCGHRKIQQWQAKLQREIALELKRGT